MCVNVLVSQCVDKLMNKWVCEICSVEVSILVGYLVREFSSELISEFVNEENIWWVSELLNKGVNE